MNKIIALFLIFLLIFEGCITSYKSYVNMPCESLKSKSEKAACYNKRAIYKAAFGDKGDALADCQKIRNLYPPDVGIGEKIKGFIDISKQIEGLKYDRCIRDIAIISEDESLCDAMDDVTSVLVKFVYNKFNIGLNKKECKDSVRAEKLKERDFNKIFDEFIKLYS